MSDKSVLIDTSIWIEYFRGKNESVAKAVDHLLDEGQLVSVDLIQAELLRGALSSKEIHVLEEHFVQIPTLKKIPSWQEVGHFSYQMARKGYLPHLVDACIALSAIINQVFIFSQDKDFKHIARHSSLRLFEI